jgi:sialidase-1
VDTHSGAIHLLLTRNPRDAHQKEIIAGTATGSRTVWATVSRDEGRTWEPLREITDAVKDSTWTWYATGPGNGIRLRSGRLLIPCDHVGADKLSWSHVIYSDDHGKNWKRGGEVGPLCNESAVAECKDGSLLFNMRSNSGSHRRAVSRSKDGGLTWSPVEHDPALIEPVCQASLIRVGKRLIFSNPAAETRRNLTVRRSDDNGRRWNTVRVVHPGPAAYSSLVDLGDGRVGLLYEAGEAGPYEEIRWTTIRI